MLTVANISKSYAAQDVLNGVTLQVDRGRRIAIVGPNGAGKTTLLRIIAGTEQPDSGSVQRAGGVTVGFLRQDVAETRGHSVLEEVLRGAEGLRRLEARMRQIEAQLEDADEAVRAPLLEEYGAVQTRFESHGGYDVEVEAQRILGGLGFTPERIERDVGELSGGWMMRVTLARLLLSSPDVLLLDEPSNHLDLGSVVWLEDFVRRYDGAVVLVSHDREFLNNVCDRIVELDGGHATTYTGNYESFVEQRQQRMEQLIAARKAQDAKVEQLQRFVDRFRYKKTKAKQAQAKLTQIDRIKAERVDVPSGRSKKARFGFPSPPRSGRVVAELNGVRKAFGDNVVFRSLDLVIERNQRVALIGPNGAGKSTLLKLLAGVEEVDGGEVKLGGNVLPAYHAQHALDVLDEDRTVSEEFRAAVDARGGGRLDARRILGSFLFSGDEVDKEVRVLSGGEKARLSLAELMSFPANLLLLDEPTNHLDMTSRDVLEDALLEYEGTVVLVTHDRHLIRAVADHIIELRDGGATVHLGDWDDYLDRLGIDDERGAVGGVAAASSVTGSDAPADRKKQKRHEAERRNRLHRETKQLRDAVERIERSLVAAEQEVADLTRELADPDVYADGARVKELVRRQGEAKDRAAALMEQWEDASVALEEATARIEREAAGR
ncbi:MAG: ABC-F family ATP-binding cassette domain-containing protein [Actinobacteria bacterium]|nr:ABC-F family ATP-binding cassette domain-containing protein [Actinomycetota bacterium]